MKKTVQERWEAVVREEYMVKGHIMLGISDLIELTQQYDIIDKDTGY